MRNMNKRSPFTMVKWRGKGDDFFKTNYVLGTANSDGQIQHWHMATGNYFLKKENAFLQYKRISE